MSKTKIEWADRVWNPVTGCTKISPGCQNCYAERMAARLKKMGKKGYKDGFKVTKQSEQLDKPLKWKKPSRIFICSMGDLFHEDVPDSFIDEVFGVILAERIFTNHRKHTFLILTKRAERLHDYLTSRTPAELLKAWAYSADWLRTDDEDVCFHELVESACCHDWDEQGRNSTGSEHKLWGYPEQLWPLRNLWIGVTAENQKQADKRIPLLLRTPATKRFVSVEPMLGPADLTGSTQIDHEDNEGYGIESIKGLDWVICGGESGPGARPMHPDWVRSLREQCKDANVPFMFKQWGEWAPYEGHGDRVFLAQKSIIVHYHEDDIVMAKIGKKKAGRLLDGQLWDQSP